MAYFILVKAMLGSQNGRLISTGKIKYTNIIQKELAAKRFLRWHVHVLYTLFIGMIRPW